MIFGVSGASGVGKTTVCNLVAEGLGLTFLKTSITEVSKRNGFNPVAKLSLQQRMILQERLLEDHVQKVSAIQAPVILDRTPIDFIGYMLAEVGMYAHESLTGDETLWISNYVQRCLTVTRCYYDFIFHLTPLPFYENADTRPAANSAYQKHCDLLWRGALNEIEDQVNMAIITATDLDVRQDFISETIINRLNYHEKTKKHSRHIN